MEVKSTIYSQIEEKSLLVPDSKAFVRKVKLRLDR